jgi:hypothetical protein
MELSTLTIKLIIVLIPGAISSIIFEKLSEQHIKWGSFKFITNSILFGVISYAFANQISCIIGIEKQSIEFWDKLYTQDLQYRFIIYASFLSIITGYVFAKIDNLKLVNKVAKFIKVSNKYGDENLISYFLNARDVNEVYVRIPAINITYHGMLNSFSANKDTVELVLRDVKVYDYESSNLTYELDKVYISRIQNELIIEIPNL